MERGFEDESSNDQKAAFIQYSFQFMADINNSTSVSLAPCKQAHCCHVKGQNMFMTAQSKQASSQNTVLASDPCQLSLEVSSSKWEHLLQTGGRAQAALPNCTALLPV